MAIVLLATFVTALMLGVILEASRSAAALNRVLTRHQTEVRRLREELAVARAQEPEEV